MSLNSSLGVVKESTYGTAVTVTRFYPLDSETIREDVQKLESQGRRAGTQVLAADQSIPILMGAGGDVEIPIMSKDFGFWLQFLFGSVSTAGPTDSAYTHTATIGTVFGKSFSAQINRPFNDSETDQPFSYEGGKVTSWEITAAVGEEPKLQMTWDFEDVKTDTSLASVSYTSGLELMSWAHASSLFTVAGTTVPIKKFSLKCDMQLKTDRHYIQGARQKKEPNSTGYRDIDWEVEADFSSLTQYNRFNAGTNTAQYAQIVMALAAPTLIGVSTYPSLTLTIPKARFDKADIENSGTDPSMQTLGGKVRWSGSSSPVTAAYVTSQATP